MQTVPAPFATLNDETPRQQAARLKQELSGYVGKRLEIPAHYDAWMMGARFGTVASVHHRRGMGVFLFIKLDRRPRKGVSIGRAALSLCRWL